jgi:hypothetical protein
VESVGDTVAEPFASTLFGPSVTSSALVVCHVSVTDWPFSMVVGFAVRVAVGAGGGGGGGGGAGCTFFLQAPNIMIVARVTINIAHFIFLCFT